MFVLKNEEIDHGFILIFKLSNVFLVSENDKD